MPRKSAAALEVIGQFPDDDKPTFRPLNRLDPPSYVSADMKAWWREVTGRYRLVEHQLKLLEAACSAWDRMTAARKEVEAEGLSYRDSKNHRRPNPAVAIERDSRIAFARLVREMGLSTEVKVSE
jgi:P27 family predicted phage terminase small subunit